MLDHLLQTVAYELVSPISDRRGGDDRELIAAVASGAADDLLGGLDVLLRVTGQTLASGWLDAVPAQRLYVDVHAADLDLLAQRHLRRLRDNGARVVLTARSPDLPSEVASLADLVRLDVRSASGVLMELPAWRRLGLRLVADNVETPAMFTTWREQGFQLYQGWFLLEPEVHATGIPHDRLSLLRLLTQVDDPDRDVDEVEERVAAQPALSYRLLRHVNSAYVGARRRIDDLRQAVTMVGPATLRDLVTVTLLEAVGGKPRELLRTVLIRAKLCEYLAPTLDVRPNTAFMVGLFTGLDAVIDRPKEAILDELPLSEEVVGAVLDLEGALGAVAGLAIAYERCDWSHPLFRDRSLGELAETYLRAVAWTEEALPLPRGLKAA